MKPHEVLGIASDATPAEAREAFRRIAWKEHPDRGGDAARFAQARTALTRFLKPAVCPECENSGRVKERRGRAVRYIDCPRCFPSTVQPPP